MVEYAAGAKVLVYFLIRQQGLSESMMHQWIGPFMLIHSMRANTYALCQDAHGRIAYAHVIQMKPYMQQSTTQPSQEEETHHDVPYEDELGNPSVAANQQVEAEPPSHTSKRDAFCHGNTTDAARTVKEQRHHQTQSTCSDFFQGGGCRVTR